jgi:DNA-binding response OmpR family regulator
MAKESIDVLVIDDDQDICIMVGAILKFAGYKVQQVSVIDKLPSIFETVEPRLILMDMLLSGNDGRDICRQLKANDEQKDITVIMMSAHPDAEKSCREAGADDFLAKPFDVDHFLGKVHRLLNE